MKVNMLFINMIKRTQIFAKGYEFVFKHDQIFHGMSNCLVKQIFLTKTTYPIPISE